MNQGERRRYILNELLKEVPREQRKNLPFNAEEQHELLRRMLNVRPPAPAHKQLLRVQNEYLREDIMKKGITNLQDLKPVRKNLYLWKGDITTLSVGAIVNAANSGLTGCYHPGHRCIDNCIHTYAGMQLRLECSNIIKKQGHEEPTGMAKITEGYNLPCDHIIHTVGPIIYGEVTDVDRGMLASCYKSCLMTADLYGIDSIAFCCISTGEFHFPNREAARIAIDTVTKYMQDSMTPMKVVFNVFKDEDEAIYKSLLQIK